MPTVHLLDYVAGNVRSLVNAIEKVGYQVEWIRKPEDVPSAEKLILPGVGHFGHCLSQLGQAGFLPAIRKHIESGKPFMGICVGLQAIFEGSLEDPETAGLGVIKAKLDRFDDSTKSVPHIGWNSANTGGADMYGLRPDSKYYYVHTYKCPYKRGELEAAGWTVATGTYGTETGVAGLRTLEAFLTGEGAKALASRPADQAALPSAADLSFQDGLTRRIIACLDVRTNDQGDLVVTKGDQYDVRENSEGGNVRNLAKPVELARRQRRVRISVIARTGPATPCTLKRSLRRRAPGPPLGAGIFHREEYTVKQVKDFLADKGLKVRQFEGDL
ncbi:imidazole glycerol phosphate synthase hisHF [Verticillium alfalfae VaMs.102]|uniref:Imidazole glycerol phosphate synthase hisHF n=1 Tax=Verticillium alfalfae (strain VaMs.102 / ATCC MYA-4576 / FGSC 10136) TaxID=526221 RepID=C9S5S7_VERA1|nr:imidazole glycerol phosphate synthase hisHF [Verticillium alfalfae VaMs.102]EEY14303.1 imidazole glycerol phosphate synthase hisHF [Verticillium alfalfae VaMs.102]